MFYHRAKAWDVTVNVKNITNRRHHWIQST